MRTYARTESSATWNDGMTWRSDFRPSGTDLMSHRHDWKCVSLRGSNRNHRVEHLECRGCGDTKTRVWKRLNEPHPSREWGDDDS